MRVLTDLRTVTARTLPARTDSHYVRSGLGTTAYGFFPIRAMAPELVARLVHGADERIAIDDLELGVDLFRRLATTPLV